MFLLSSLSNMINDSVSHWFGGRWVGSLIFIFSILTINKKQIWLPEAVTRIFNYSWRYISILTSNKTNRESTATWSSISFIYKNLLQTFRNSICLVKEFFLVFFEKYYDKIHNSYLAKYHSFFVFFSFYCQFVPKCNLVVLSPNKTSLKLCKRKSDLLSRMLKAVFVIVSMTQYVENFNLKIPHGHVCRRCLKIQFRSLM